MIALILAAAAASTVPIPTGPTVRARATIRILQGASITAEAWKRQPTPREKIVTDESGPKSRLRTVDFE